MNDLLHVLEFAVPLVQAAGITVIVSIGAFFVALTLGLGLASLRHFYASPLIRWPIQAYIELFRNIPSLTHLFILFYGLAYLGLRLGSITAAIVGLGLIGAASLSETFRAGFESLHHGQREAALAVGMSPFMAFREVILPQTWRITLPPIGNYAVQLIKDTSLVAAIAAPEIMFTARNLVVNTFETTLVYTLAATIYLALCLPLSRAVRYLETKAATPR